MFKTFLRDESGTTAIEYGLIVAIVSIVLVTVLGTVGAKLTTVFTTIATAL